MDEIVADDGTVTRARPDHDCKGLWIGRVDLDPGSDGERRRREVSSLSYNVARRKLNESRQAKDKHGDLPTSQTTVEDWIGYWFREVCSVAPKTRSGYKSCIQAHIIPALGKKRLDRLGIAQVRELYKLMAANNSSGSRPQTHRVLNKALNDAVLEGKLTHNPIAKMPTPKGTGRIRQNMRAELAKTLLGSLTDDRLASRWQWALKTGSRPGEALGLEWTRLDLSEGVADVSWQQQRLAYDHGCGAQDKDGRWPCGRRKGGYCPDRWLNVPEGYEKRHILGGLWWVRPKSAAGVRMMPLVPSLVDSLKLRQKAYQRERRDYQQDYGLVWCRADGHPLDPKDDAKLWREACQNAGVPAMERYTGRHTTATLLLQAGVDRHIVQQLLGHSDERTSRGYQHVDLTMAREALLEAEKLLT